MDFLKKHRKSRTIIWSGTQQIRRKQEKTIRDAKKLEADGKNHVSDDVTGCLRPAFLFLRRVET